MKPAVSIIVLNYNGREDTLACLRSLEHLTYPNTDIIVVDNQSADGTVAAVRQAHPNITIIETGANLGFTGGNNVGIRHALEHNADYIMLLNNDTVVAPDLIDIMIEVMEADPTIGVGGPMLYYYSAPETIWSAGGSIDWQRGTTSMIGLNEDDHAQYGLSPRPTDFVSGCCLLARRGVWERAGLLDEKFFMYYEETEWCVRASRAGFKIVHIPMAMLWHKISIEQRAASPRTHYYMTRNRLLFLRRTGAGFRPLLFTLGEYARTVISWSVRTKWQDKRPLR
ncbi:MAG TPA: glycosyltransferase family 2 protein, partial [Phototrophicaceae bacterium]|nr:glycosyltransferase family 2 protein [Phototrophicaceae bacterium]